MDCSRCGSEVTVHYIANTRDELPLNVVARCHNPGCNLRGRYSPREVRAIAGRGLTLGGAVAGGLLGAIIGGPIGLIVGGTLGAGAGGSADNEDQRRARRFNES